MAASRETSTSGRGALHSFRPVLDRVVLGLGMLGILLAVHLWIQQGRGFDRGCFGFSEPDPTLAVGCEVVTSSMASTLFGIPNALLGGLFFLGVVLLTMIAAAAPAWRYRAKAARLGLVVAGFLYSAYLVYYQYAVVEEWCVLCTISAGLVTLLLILHAAGLMTGRRRSADQPFVPMKREFSLYALAAVLIVVLAGADILYFTTLDDAHAAPEAPAQAQAANEPPAATPSRADRAPSACRYDAEKDPIENWRDFVRFSDPVKGSPDAPVTVIELFDPNCPHCKTLHPVMQRVAEQNADDALFVYKPFALWDYSVPQVLALHVAAQQSQDKFFEMVEAQFARQQRGGLDVDQLRDIARELRMDPDQMVQRMRNQALQESVMQERQQLYEQGVRSMPTVLINGRFVGGPRTAECLTELIQEAAGEAQEG